MLVELSNLPPLPELVHYAGRPGDWVTVSHGDVAPYNSHDLFFVPVCVDDVTGYYCVQMHKVFSGGRILSPTGFETLGGKEGNRKWRLSLRILMPNGHKGKTLGKYLVDHNLDHLVPKRSSISDGEDCSPDKTNSTTHDTTNALRGRNTMPQVVTRPRRGRNALSASPVKKTSPMKKKAHEQTRRRRTKSVDSASLSSSNDRREQGQVQINVQASFPYANVGLPVVCSGTPVTVRHHNADMPRPLEQPSPPLGTWHVIRRYRHQDFFDNDTDQSNMGVSDYLDYNSMDYSLPLKSNPHEHLDDGDDDDDLLLHSFDLKDSEQPQ